MKSSFKRTIKWNKYQSKVITQAPNQYSDCLIDPSFRGVNRPFALSFEFNTDRTVHTQYYLPTVQMKYYNVMIDEINFFDQPVKNNLTYDNIRKIATSQRGNYPTGYLLDYNYFNKYYKMIAIELSTKQAFDADTSAILSSLGKKCKYNSVFQYLRSKIHFAHN